MPIRILSVCLLLSLAAACEEKPAQQLVQDEKHAAKRDQRQVEDDRRQRTLGQSESNRIYNDGGLR